MKEAATKSAIGALALAMSVASASWAAESADSWENLNRLREGETIEVVDMNLKSLKGTFMGFSEEAVSLRVKQDDVIIKRADVFRVSSRAGSRRARNTLIGLAIGASMGAAIAGCSFESPCDWPPSKESAIGAGVGAAAGALVGAALPGHPTIYRARKVRPGEVE